MEICDNKNNIYYFGMYGVVISTHHKHTCPLCERYEQFKRDMLKEEKE